MLCVYFITTHLPGLPGLEDSQVRGQARSPTSWKHKRVKILSMTPLPPASSQNRSWNFNLFSLQNKVPNLQISLWGHYQPVSREPPSMTTLPQWIRCADSPRRSYALWILTEHPSLRYNLRERTHPLGHILLAGNSTSLKHNCITLPPLNSPRRENKPGHGEYVVVYDHHFLFLFE